MKKLTPSLIKQMASGIRGIVLLTTETDTSALPHVERLCRTLDEFRSKDPRWTRLDAETKRKWTKLIVCLKLIYPEIAKQEEHATPTT
jgi:hypothetical protein